MSINDLATVEAHNKGYTVSTLGVVTGVRGHCLKTRRHPHCGYLYFSCLTSRGIKIVYVHKLQAYQKFGSVALDDGVVVRHLDGNKQNNGLDNISIGSLSDNSLDVPHEERVRHMARANGKGRTLSKEAFMSFMSDRRHGMTYARLAEKYGLAGKVHAYQLCKNPRFYSEYKASGPALPSYPTT